MVERNHQLSNLYDFITEQGNAKWIAVLTTALGFLYTGCQFIVANILVLFNLVLPNYNKPELELLELQVEIVSKLIMCATALITTIILIFNTWKRHHQPQKDSGKDYSEF